MNLLFPFPNSVINNLLFKQGEVAEREKPIGSNGVLSQKISSKNDGSIIIDQTSDKEVLKMINFKGAHYPQAVILMAIRWYVAYPLSYRDVEELLKERGVEVDHATLNRWVIKYAPELEKSFRSCKKAVGKSWRMDETYIRVKGEWVYLPVPCGYIEQLIKQARQRIFICREHEICLHMLFRIN